MAKSSAPDGPRTWMRVRVFPTESEMARAQRLWTVAFGTFVVVAISLVALIATEPSTAARRLVTLAGVMVLTGIIYVVNRRGHTSGASWMFVLGLVVIVTQRAWITGGIYAPVLPLYVVFVLMGGVLLSRLGGIITAVACAAGATMLVIGQAMGAIQPVRTFAPPLGMLVFLMMILALALVLQFMVGNTFRESLARSEREIAVRKATQTRLDLAMAAAKIVVWELDRERGQLLSDARMGELYHIDMRPDGSVALDDVLARIHPDDLAGVLERRDRVREGMAPAEHHHRIVRPDGSLRYVRGTSVWVPVHGHEYRIIGVTMDVTDSALADIDRTRLVHDLGERVKELRLLHATAVAAQRHWNSTRELLAHVVGLMPLAWQYPECAEARITLGDMEVATAGWRQTTWMQSVPFVTQSQEGSIEVAYTEEKPPETEGPFLKEERDLLVSLSEMLAAILNSQKTRRDLELLVETRTTELRAARDAAEQAARAKGAFLANMSHEIRTPMNAILGYEQLLQTDPNLTNEQRRRLDVIRTSGDHLLGLINDILDMSRIEAGRVHLSVQPFDLHATLDDIGTMFATQIATRGISLGVQVDASVPQSIRADPGKVRQVLINLIGNAVKFTEAGGVRVRVDAARTGETQCLVKIEVEDTGSGIDPSDFDLIFGAFGQATGGAARGGTGLGLAISRNFARMMDGDIAVRSARGHGSTFTFTFAGTIVEDGAVETLGARDVRRRLAAGVATRRVLVVDDVPTNRDLLSETLTRAGFETRPAETAEEAIDTHDWWHPDLIVTDLHMPGMGGAEAIRKLRARGSTTPVIVVTASTDEDTAATVREAGAQRLLRKPHRQNELLDAVAAVLGVELVAREPSATPREVRIPTAPLREMVQEIPGPLVVALLEAARTARAARVLQLATEVQAHSPGAAESIRRLAHNFQYGALVDALEEKTLRAD